MRVRAERIEELVNKLDAIADPAVQAVARELVQSVTELHVKGLERVLEIVSDSGAVGMAIIDQLGDDELVGPLMALHDLHPLTLEERVSRSMKKVAAVLQKHGASAELLGVRDGNVRVRLATASHGCGSGASSAVVELEDALYQAAPDLTSIFIEEEMVPANGFVPLEALSAASVG